MERSFEREIIPMAREFGMALAPWDVLSAGKFRTDEEEQRRKETGEKGRTISRPDWERNEIEVKMSKALEVVAAEVGAVGNLTAGVFRFRVLDDSLTPVWDSCYRVCHAQDSICLSDHWRQKGRGPQGEHQSSRYQANREANGVSRERRTL